MPSGRCAWLTIIGNWPGVRGALDPGMQKPRGVPTPVQVGRYRSCYRLSSLEPQYARRSWAGELEDWQTTLRLPHHAEMLIFTMV